MNPVQRERRLFLLHDVGGYPSHVPPPPPGATLTIDPHDLDITNATNASPIVITTDGNHGRVTGDKVTIASVGGNTAANGDWVVTKVDDTTFSLDGSTGSGAYTSGGTVKHNIDETEQLTKEIWATAEASQLNFSLVNPPSGFNIAPTGQNTGANRHRTIMTCQPPEQGSLPKVVTVRVRATDGNLVKDKVISFNVTDLNHEPDLWDENNVIEYETAIHQQLSILFEARDQDIPADTLTFSLDATAGPYPNEGQDGYDGTPEGDAIPAGAAINSSTGRFTWTPSATGTTHITVRVTDNGTPNLDRIWTIKVTVIDVFQAGDCTNTYAGPHADIVASSETAGFEAWKAFDASKTGPGWRPSGALPQWLRYDFTAGNAKVIRHVTLYGSFTAAAFEIEASNDAAAWTSLGTWSNKTGTQMQFDTKNRDAYRYYRITFTADSGTLEVYHMDLDCNLDTGEVFGISDDGTTTARLVAVDAESGAVRDIGALTGTGAPFDPDYIKGFAIDYRNRTTGNTTAYAVLPYLGTYYLYTIDIETAVCTPVGSCGGIGSGSFLMFDAVSDRLYLAHYLSGDDYKILRLNVGTGAVISTVTSVGLGTRVLVGGITNGDNGLFLSCDEPYTEPILGGGGDPVWGSQLIRYQGVSGKLNVEDWAVARVADQTFLQEESYAACAFRDEKDDTTQKWLYIFEDGDADNLTIWKADVAEGAKSVSATYDQTVGGKIVHASAPYQVSAINPPTKNYELLKVEAGRIVGTALQSGDIVQRESILTGEILKHHEWDIVDSDTSVILASGSWGNGVTGESNAKPFSAAGGLFANEPTILADKTFHVAARDAYGANGAAPTELRSVDLRWFKSDQTLPIDSAVIIRGVAGDEISRITLGSFTQITRKVDRGSSELAPGLIDGSASYQLGTLDWIELTLTEPGVFEFINWVGTLHTSKRYFWAYPLTGSFPAQPFQCRNQNSWLSGSPPGTSFHIHATLESMNGFPSSIWGLNGTNTLDRVNGVPATSSSMQYYRDNKEAYPGYGGYASKLIIHASTRVNGEGPFTIRSIKLGT